MPNQTRPQRSLLALLVITGLVAAGSPPADARSSSVAATAGRGAASAPGATFGNSRSTSEPDYDRGPSLRSSIISGRAVNRPALAPALSVESVAASTPRIERVRPNVPQPRPKSDPLAKAGTAGNAGGRAAANYQGRNHLWIPALDIDRSVSAFACTSSAYPGDRVYRWGCAGKNNVYLFGHAYSVFKPLHDAYVRGRLKKGMQLYYADTDGSVSTYAVTWWKVTTPDKGAWAYAGQSEKSVTLQTCVGAKSQYRLIVRLVKVG
ncbi:MAG: sortase [Candidatus Limnocylindrales bacterium]